MTFQHPGQPTWATTDLGAITAIVNETDPDDPTSVDEMRWSSSDLSRRRRGSSPRPTAGPVGAAGVGRIYVLPPEFDGVLGDDRRPRRRAAGRASGRRC